MMTPRMKLPAVGSEVVLGQYGDKATVLAHDGDNVALLRYEDGYEEWVSKYNIEVSIYTGIIHLGTDEEYSGEWPACGTTDEKAEICYNSSVVTCPACLAEIEKVS